MCGMSIPEDEAARSPSSKHSMNQRTAGSGSRHDPKFHLHSSGPFLQVGRVGPVVLHRNWREQVVLTRGTNLSRAVYADRQSFMVVPPVPPISTTKSLRFCLQYHWYPRSHRVTRLPCLGMQKRVPEILELRRRLPSILFSLSAKKTHRPMTWPR